MIRRYGMAAYTNGYHVYTTISSPLQRVASQSVIDGLISYDKRHGYRGPEGQFPPGDSGSDTISLWRETLEENATHCPPGARYRHRRWRRRR